MVLDGSEIQLRGIDMLDIYDEKTWGKLSEEDKGKLREAVTLWLADTENNPSTLVVTWEGEPCTIDFWDPTTWPGYVEPVPEGKSTPSLPKTVDRIGVLEAEVASLKQRLSVVEAK